MPVAGQRPQYENVIRQVSQGGSSEEHMFVVGATRPSVLSDVRALAPEHFFLVPGIGAQGGDLSAVLEAGLTSDGGLLINSSRGILYAGKGEDAIAAARRAAQDMQQAMATVLHSKAVI